MPLPSVARMFSTSSRSCSKRQPSPLTADTKTLTHLDASGAAHMVTMPPPTNSTAPSLEPKSNSTASPSSATSTEKAVKPATWRTAIARCLVHFSNEKPATLIRTAALKKGDVLGVSRIAGIMAAKRTPDIIPLCHNIPLSGVSVDVELVGSSTNDEQVKLHEAESVGPYGGVVVTATVHCFGQTGVEMEALTAAGAAAMTAYDMCKGVDRGMKIDNLRVVLKEGGKSGRWVEGKSS